MPNAVESAIFWWGKCKGYCSAGPFSSPSWFGFTVHRSALFSPRLLYSHLFPHLCLSLLSIFLKTTFLFITPVPHHAKFSSLHFILSLGTWLSLFHRCARLSLSLSRHFAPSLPPWDVSKSSSHRTTLISSLSSPTISLLTSTCPPIHPFHLSRLLEWMIQIDALCTLSQSSHTQSTAPALSSLPFISLPLSLFLSLYVTHTNTHTHSNAAQVSFTPGPSWIGEVWVDTMRATKHFTCFQELWQ